MVKVYYDKDNGNLLVTGDAIELTKVVTFVNSMNSNDALKKAFGNEENDEEHDAVNHPSHYCSGKIETIDKIEAVIDGLPAKKAASLANVLKYFDRAGLKDDTKQDLDKANNYAHRLVHGKWRNEE